VRIRDGPAAVIGDESWKIATGIKMPGRRSD